MANNEWTGSSVKDCASSYSTLACYLGKKPTMAPIGAGSQTGYIVPSYGNIGYDSLTHGDKATGCGYFKIKDAYNRDPTKYVTRACGGCNPPNGFKPGTAHPAHPTHLVPAHPTHPTHLVPAHLLPHPANLVPGHHSIPAHLLPHPTIPAHHATGGFNR